MFKPTVLGTAVLALKIARLGPVRKARLQRGFEKRGAELVETIKDRTPVLKGRLRNSVRMEPARKYPGVVIIAGGTPETARGPNLDEALLTEYGTRHEKAEPFFWPTIHDQTQPVRRGLADDIRDDSDD